MDSNTILQSDLLDIIFENRNKEYGAYLLRKNYQRRMSLSLLLAFAIVLALFLIPFFAVDKTIVNDGASITKTHEYKASDFINEKSGTQKNVASVFKKKASAVKNPETIPHIVDGPHINKIIASENALSTSDIEISGNGSLNNATDPGMNTGFPDATSSLIVTKKTEIIENRVLPVAEGMPQFPGGMKALLAYLKKNLHAPDDLIEEGKTISVKVKFVVNYNGKLENFLVIQSGGEVFDSEVLRVLKTMPLWIPGKSSGENVSVYYIVPVKFTNEY